MTNQTDYDVTNEDRRIACEWASHVHRNTDKYSPAEQAAARVILNTTPALLSPTLVGMTEEERQKCDWTLINMMIDHATRKGNSND